MEHGSGSELVSPHPPTPRTRTRQRFPSQKRLLACGSRRRRREGGARLPRGLGLARAPGPAQGERCRPGAASAARPPRRLPPFSIPPSPPSSPTSSSSPSPPRLSRLPPGEHRGGSPLRSAPPDREQPDRGGGSSAPGAALGEPGHTHTDTDTDTDGTHGQPPAAPGRGEEMLSRRGPVSIPPRPREAPAHAGPCPGQPGAAAPAGVSSGGKLRARRPRTAAAERPRSAQHPHGHGGTQHAFALPDQPPNPPAPFFLIFVVVLVGLGWVVFLGGGVVSFLSLFFLSFCLFFGLFCFLFFVLFFFLVFFFSF